MRLSFLPPLPLQVSVIKPQRLYDKIRFLPSGYGFRYELGYPLILKSRLLFLVWLILLHDALDNLVCELSLLHKLLHFDSVQVVLVYKCGQEKLNNLYYQMKEQRR